MKETIIAIVGVIVGAILTLVIASSYQSPAPQDSAQSNVGAEVRAPDVHRVTYANLQTTYRRNGDTNFQDGNGALNLGTTTVCAIQSPLATSTLIAGYIQENVSSSTASTVTIAKSSTAFATTTLINSVAVSANAQATILAASTTVSALEQTNRTFAPGQWLVFGQQGGVGTFSPSGVCGAQWLAVIPNT